MRIEASCASVSSPATFYETRNRREGRKTAIAGILTRLLAERGDTERGRAEVWAIDAESDPNFGVTLGISPEQVMMSGDQLPRIC